MCRGAPVREETNATGSPVSSEVAITHDERLRSQLSEKEIESLATLLDKLRTGLEA